MSAITLSADIKVAVGKLELRPQDALVVKVDGRIDMQIAARIREAFEGLRADGGKILVLDSYTDLSVIRGADS